MMSFFTKYEKNFKTKQNFLCVGLDPDLGKIPARFKTSKNPILDFNRFVIEQTANSAIAYKPNLAFYEAYGEIGNTALLDTCKALKELDIPVVLDAKRGDIGNTAEFYAKAIFDDLGGDATTLAPYMGFDSVGPFAAHIDKLSFVLGLTSNQSASDFELLELKNGKKLYQAVMEKVTSWREKHPNIGLVVGATQEKEIKEIAQITKNTPLLVPGVGAQGGDLKAVIENLYSNNILLINVGRAVLYAENPKQAAENYALEMKKIAGF